MRWFNWFRNAKGKAPEVKGPKSRRPRADPPRSTSRRRRERYSGWNDPDLPTYGDPFDG